MTGLRTIFGCMALLASLTFAAATSPAAAEPPFQLLGQPCRGFNVLATRAIKTPDGNEYFVLSNTNETSGVELIFVDFKNNTAKKYPAPVGSGAWLLNRVPGDRLIVGTYYDGKLMVFDLKTMKFTKVIPFPKEEYFWNGALGSDGRLYGGTYPGAKLGALNLDTYALEDCGAPAPPNLYCRNVSPTPDGRLLCNFVTEKQVTKLYDPKSKKWSGVPASIAHVQRAVVWNGYLLAASAWDGGETAGPVAFKGPDFEPVDPPPFPVPPGKSKWSVDLFLTTPDTLYLRQGNAIYRFDNGGKEPRKIFDQDLKSGAINAVASDGTLLGVRGQDYLIAKPGETTATLRPIPVEPSPRPMHWIRPDNHGTLWGGPQFGQTIFSVDLATKKFTNTGIVTNAGGEVYDAAFKDGKVYLASYVGGDITEYDPQQPWDQMAGKNPRNVAHLTSKGFIRPTGGIHLGPDGKLYSGWMAKYGSYGGAIAVTDLSSKETKLYENPLGEQAIGGLAVDEQFLYAGTALAGNGLPTKPNEKPQFGILERDTGKVIYQQPLPGPVAKLVLDAKAHRVVIQSGGALLLFDAQSRKFVDPPKGLPTVHDIDAPGDGAVYLGCNEAVVRLDLASGKTRSFAAPAKAEKVAVAADGTVFIASGPNLYRMPAASESSAEAKP